MSRKKKKVATLAVAYVRVSTSEQELGPQVQTAAIRKWCERHGIELATEPFIDLGMSGGLDLAKRPALVDAIDALKIYNAAILVAHKRDRIARDRGVIGNLMLLLRKMGCRICTTERPPGDADDIDPMLKAMEGVADVFAELERSLISQRTKAALQTKRRKGERVGTIPYGFRLAADGRRLVPDNPEQKLVKIVRQMHADGSSLRAIAQELQSRGYRPKTGKRWHASTIKRILEFTDPEGLSDDI